MLNQASYVMKVLSEEEMQNCSAVVKSNGMRSLQEGLDF